MVKIIIKGIHKTLKLLSAFYESPDRPSWNPSALT